MAAGMIHLGFVFMVMAGLGAAVQGIRRRATLLGQIVLGGAIVHGAAAAAFFCISWFNLPILAWLHSGDGFWHLAIDARTYYRLASLGATQGLEMIGGDVPSPLFIRTLAVWMSLTGVHLAAPLLLNFAVYVMTCASIVYVARSSETPRPPDLAIAVPLVAISGSPLLLLSGTQILKDMVFACALAVTLLGIRSLLRRIDEPAAHWSASAWRASAWAIAGTMLWLSIGVYVVAGIRPYYAIFICGALAITLGVFVLFGGRWRNVRFIGVSAATLFVAWLGLVYGADQYYLYYRDAAVSTIDAATGRVFSPLLTVSSPPVRAPGWNSDAPSVTANAHTMREGFVLLGGDTTLVRRNRSTETSSASRWGRARDAVEATSLGLAAMFVPASLLTSAGIIEITGGRGLLPITDLDTLFLDATAIAVGWLLIRNRHALGRDRAYLCFCLVMFAIVTLMLAYILTNLGMLLRLRVIALLPLWMAPLAISRTPVSPELTCGPEARSA